MKLSSETLDRLNNGRRHLHLPRLVLSRAPSFTARDADVQCIELSGWTY
jgi:hypothetical protein